MLVEVGLVGVAGGAKGDGGDEGRYVAARCGVRLCAA